MPWLLPVWFAFQTSMMPTNACEYSYYIVVAIRSLNGPTIPWSSGRVDEMDPSKVTPDGRLPSADSGPPGADKEDSKHLREIFNRMGFDKDQEIVALSGAHARKCQFP